MSEPEIAPAVLREPSEVKTAPPAVPVQSESSPLGRGTIRCLDLLERLIVLSFYAYFFWNFISRFLENPTWPAALVIASESVTVLFLMIRRPARSFSTSLGAWSLAIGTTVAPALLYPGKEPLDAAWVGAGLMIAGACGRIICTIYLGRSFGVVPANRGVKRNGPYRLVRHPLYTTYLIYQVGIFWLNPTPRNLWVIALCWVLLVLRTLVEESHLSQDPAYVEYQQEVRFRLIPGLF